MSLRKRLFLVGLLVSYAIAIAAGFICIWPGRYDAISAWSVALTGSVVLWYTWETMHLRRAAYEQKELQLMPFVVLNISDQVFYLQNVGAGLAVNVKVKDVVLHSQEKIRIRFPDTIPLISPGEKQTVAVQSFHGEANMGDFFASHLDKQFAIADLQIDIEFNNIEMQLYRLSEKVGPGYLNILGIKKLT